MPHEKNYNDMSHAKDDMYKDEHMERMGDIKNSMDKIDNYCPTCGRKYGGSTTGEGSIGGSAAGGGG